MEQTAQQKKFMGMLKPNLTKLERFALAMARNREEAKDIVGETVMLAWEGFHTVRSQQAFLSFLFTIASRVYRRRQKQLIRFRTIEIEEAGQLYSNTLAPDEAADIEILYRAMAKLPAPQREAIAMAEITGMPHKEIAEVQQCSLSAVKMKIVRGKEKLKKMLSDKTPNTRRNVVGEINSIWSILV